ncbi:Beta-barrel assembly machine subunit BamE [Humitalea rosea]|uniref:Beta-barrel assembly machine subunit BamE n=1 Tax=Humitalea rosea TaxID=990373 RepID=A0A2W7IXR3_9PROT|nr:outer membrane protein assembly factor BamE [Humitalea rosea]PZW50985.1 Beta-barrel assembly machine subunit BamE [Humitalea rosea]
MVRAPIRVNVFPPRLPARAVVLMVALLATAALPGCGAGSPFGSPLQVRGHQVDAEQIREVVVGTHTKADVQAILGSPTATGTFDDNQWYYISGQTRLQPLRTLSLEDQRVVVVRFDDRGVAREVSELDRAAGRDVQIVERQTPVPGTDRTLLQQLFGNLGRLGPGVPGQSASGQGR